MVIFICDLGHHQIGSPWLRQTSAKHLKANQENYSNDVIWLDSSQARRGAVNEFTLTNIHIWMFSSWYSCFFIDILGFRLQIALISLRKKACLKILNSVVWKSLMDKWEFWKKWLMEYTLCLMMGSGEDTSHLEYLMPAQSLYYVCVRIMGTVRQIKMVELLICVCVLCYR